MSTNLSIALKGIAASVYGELVAAAESNGVVDWQLLPGDEDAQADTYWAAKEEDLIDEFGELVELYQCDGCTRYFYPADLSVADGSGEYCWNDGTGNGCRDAHLDETG
jgi:hypothetical protein